MSYDVDDALDIIRKGISAADDLTEDQMGDMLEEVKSYWEPGYDYDDEKYWIRTYYWDALNADFIRAVRSYDRLHRDDEQYSKEYIIRTGVEADADLTETQVIDGVEYFWEPGYDYDDPDFWTSYDGLTVDFIRSVRSYDRLHRDD